MTMLDSRRTPPPDTLDATIAPAELYKRHQLGERLRLIDVRTPAEFRELHVPFAENVPLHRLDASAVAGKGQDGPIYVMCRTGARSAKACDLLRHDARGGAVSVDGGTSAWLDAGLPVVRGKKAMSLERQVRIAAGSLVLLGIGLAWWVHPAFAGLSAFVGAGLVFAGVTDTCGMGMLLVRMPWNATCQDNQGCSRD